MATETFLGFATDFRSALIRSSSCIVWAVKYDSPQLMKNKTFRIVKYTEIGRFSANNGRRQALGMLMRNKTFRMVKCTKIARFSANNGPRQGPGML